ncbi:MAG: ATP-binding cassette domain-containing protein [Nitrospinae bacterium]|nr:ATP-binding cassette domain-containing protein [Nitrospinota bacterium]MBL7020562.1 ATP-binding cassette domain-containing protein [Nitrospinaceae bacterium]
MITLDQVSKSYDGVSRVINNLSFEVLEGEILILLGSSGCGKSTILKMINRLIDPTEGRIYLDGKDIQQQDPIELRRSLGYVFQGIGLFPHFSIRENISMVPRLLGWPEDRINNRYRELLELVQLSPEIHADRFPDELSGGQQQRVAVARALAADPAYLLMDEPFGALDAITRDSIQQEFLDLKQRLNKTIIFVTHDIIEAVTLGDRIAILHEGRLEQIGTSEEIMENPATDFVRELFAKSVKFWKGFKNIS